MTKAKLIKKTSPKKTDKTLQLNEIVKASSHGEIKLKNQISRFTYKIGDTGKTSFKKSLLTAYKNKKLDASKIKFPVEAFLALKGKSK